MTSNVMAVRCRRCPLVGLNASLAITNTLNRAIDAAIGEHLTV
jgi:hypothetical protein